MERKISVWLLSAALAGALSAGPGSARVAAQEKPSGTPPTEQQEEKAEAAARKADLQQAEKLRMKIRQDKAQLQADVKKFGRNSAQVQADEAALQADRAALASLKAQLQKERAEERKEEMAEHPGRHSSPSGIRPEPPIRRSMPGRRP